MNDLTNKVALITGATSGIGEACAMIFACAGATVLVAGRNKEKGRAIVEDIVSKNGKADFIELDIASDKSIDDSYEYVNEKYGKLDILVNNAGIFPVTPTFEDMTREFGNQVFDINISGTIMVTKRFFEMLRKNRGNILNNASIAGLQSTCSGAAYAYAASKAGIIKFTQLLAKKYGSEVRVNCICPGVIRTPIFETFDEVRYASSIPMGRVGEPVDVAKVACFLVSDDAGYMNGCILTVDGGQSL